MCYYLLTVFIVDIIFGDEVTQTQDFKDITFITDSY